MGICQVCDNEYDKTFEILLNNKKYVFDCFECAIHKLAPQCQVCSCRIIGHGFESNLKFFCCAHCAKKAGLNSATDRINT